MCPDIKNNDILVVDKSRSVFSGAIIAFYFNGTPMCKEILELESRTYLKSSNPKCETIVVSSEDELTIFGVVGFYYPFTSVTFVYYGIKETAAVLGKGVF